MNIKKIALVLFILVSICSFSQTEKGKYTIGANSNLSFSKTNGKIRGQNNTYERDLGSTTQFDISPEIGYSFLKNFFVGIGFNYQYSNEDLVDFSYWTKSNSYLSTLFLKYYFSENRFKPFLKTAYGFGVENREFQFTDISSRINNSKTKIQNFTFGAGIGYFLTNYISLEMSLNYSYLKTNEKGTLVSDNNASRIFNGFNSNIGFYIFL